MAELDEASLQQQHNQHRLVNGVDRGLHERQQREPNGSMARPDVDRNIAVSQIRDAAQQMHTDFVDQMTDRMNNILDGVLGQVTNIGELDSPMEENPKGKTLKRSRLAPKMFVPRESVLTTLLLDKNIQTIYNIFVAILIVIIMNTLITDLIETGSLRIDFSILSWGFSQAPTVLWTWFLMQCWAMLVFYCTFQYWAQHETRHYSPLKIYIPDAAWLLVYIVYQSLFLYMPMKVNLTHSLPFASSVIVTAEQTRLMMKMHAFMRENAPRALKWKQQLSSQETSKKRNRSGDVDVDDLVARGDPGSDSSEFSADTPCPDFSKYLYFLFCPTLVYRDNYPRTAKIRWDVVRINFLQVVGCLFYTFYLFDCFCFPLFKNFSAELFTIQSLARAAFTCMLPATLILLLAFFAILHSWLNAFAEMLRFADRQFYKDWWTCKSYSAYYRTWNGVVHDWLYTYIYRDCQLIGLGRLTSSMTVFIISAAFHEYIIIMALRFFYPVLVLFFVGVGVPLFLMMGGEKSSVFWNVFMWVSLICGMGLIIVMYMLEWHSRIHCIYDRDSFSSLIIPQSWGCQLS